MFSPTRVIATVLVFVCLILTLLSAFLVSTLVNLFVDNALHCQIFAFLVEKEWTCSIVLHYPVSGHDVVFVILYSVCSRYSEKNCFYLYGIEANTQQQRYILSITYVHLLHRLVCHLNPMCITAVTQSLCVFFSCECAFLLYYPSDFSDDQFSQLASTLFSKCLNILCIIIVYLCFSSFLQKTRKRFTAMLRLMLWHTVDWHKFNDFFAKPSNFCMSRESWAWLLWLHFWNNLLLRI